MVGHRVVEDRLKRRLGEIRKRRRGLAQPQEPLGGHHDEWARRRIESLPAQQMEELSGGRAVDDADVVLGGELEEALEPRAGVLRTVALVAMGKKQGEP